MTQTDRQKQEPRECEWYNAKYCEETYYYSDKKLVMHPCRLHHPTITHCSDFTPKQEPRECKHMDDWWCCKRTKEIINDEEWVQTCDYYPQCSDCPDFTLKPEEK